MNEESKNHTAQYIVYARDSTRLQRFIGNYLKGISRSPTRMRSDSGSETLKYTEVSSGLYADYGLNSRFTYSKYCLAPLMPGKAIAASIDGCGYCFVVCFVLIVYLPGQRLFDQQANLPSLSSRPLSVLTVPS